MSRDDVLGMASVRGRSVEVQEVNFRCGAEQDVPRVSAQAQIEGRRMREGEEQGERSRVGWSHCLSMKACPYF